METSTQTQSATDNAWRKCDVCGKFISYDDLNSGKAIHWMKEPDSDLSCETWETLCKDHNGYRNIKQGGSK